MKTYFKNSSYFFVSILLSLFSSCAKDSSNHLLDFPEVDYDILPQSNDALALQAIPLYSSQGRNFKYLTLFDEARTSGIAVKVSTDDVNLLNALTSESVTFYTTDKLHFGEFEPESDGSKSVESRSALQTVEIEVIEARIAKWVKYYGVQFEKPNLIPSTNFYKFLYKNHAVQTVYVTGKVKEVDAFRINCAASVCADCNIRYLAPRFSLLDRSIIFTDKTKANFELSLNQRFSDQILILW